MKTKIWSAAIDCDTGDVLLYAAATKAEVEKQVADYCRQHWDEDEMDGGYGEFESDANTIETYFEVKGDESCTIDETNIDLSTISAVAALIVRNAELEGFVSLVAGAVTVDEIMDGHGNGAADYIDWAEDDSIVEDIERLDGYIAKARALAAPSSGGAAS
jgi:hypothetical protein